MSRLLLIPRPAILAVVLAVNLVGGASATSSIRALAPLDAPPGNVVCCAYLGRQSTGLARNREMGQ